MSIEKNLLKEAQSEARKDKIKKIWSNHKKLIITALAAILALIIIITSFNIYKKEQKKKYSSLMHQIFIDEQNDDFASARSKLENLYQDQSVPDGIKSLALLKYAASLLKEGDIENSVKVYLEINQNNNYDIFVRELAGLNALKILIDSDNEGYNKQIIDLTASLEKNSQILTYFIIEQKAIFEWRNNNFKIAHEIFSSLLDNPEVSQPIKERAEKMINIYNTQKQ